MERCGRTIFWKRWLATVLRYLMAGLFLWAGVVKLADPKAFARSVDAFGLVPDSALIWVAFGLPILEIFVAVAVAMRWRSGLFLMAAQLMLFIAVLWFAILNDLDIDCGCFSLAEQKTQSSLKLAFWRDWLMLLVIVSIFFFERNTANRAWWPQRGKGRHHELA